MFLIFAYNYLNKNFQRVLIITFLFKKKFSRSLKFLCFEIHT